MNMRLEMRAWHMGVVLLFIVLRNTDLFFLNNVKNICSLAASLEKNYLVLELLRDTGQPTILLMV